MLSLTLRLSKGVALVVTLGLVASCGLPRSGPNKAEIFSGSGRRTARMIAASISTTPSAMAIPKKMMIGRYSRRSSSMSVPYLRRRAPPRAVARVYSRAA